MKKLKYFQWLSILELSKILMHEFGYDYVKPNMVKKQIAFEGYRQFHCIQKNR